MRVLCYKDARVKILEDTNVRSSIAPLILAPLMFATTPVFAQGNPSADQIINSLKPTGNLMAGGTRGIRLAAPSGEGTAPAQAQSQRGAGGEPVRRGSPRRSRRPMPRHLRRPPDLR